MATKLDNIEGSVANSNLQSHLDTLPRELVCAIIPFLSCDTDNEWHPIDLYRVGGVLGDALHLSFRDMEVQFSNLVHARKWLNDEELVNFETSGDETIVVFAWGRHFMLESPILIDSCKQLRSLDLNLLSIPDSNIVSLDSVFVACGNVLEKLKLIGGGLIFPSVSVSIGLRCPSLNSLSLQYYDGNVSLLSLFRSIGWKLRKLELPEYEEQYLIGMAQCCPGLEDVKIYGGHMPFIANLPVRSSPRAVRFLRCPTVDQLTTLVHRSPNIMISITVLDYEDELEEIIRICGKQINVLHLDITHGPSHALEALTDSMDNLEELKINAENEHMRGYLEAFLSVPRPKLCNLSISCTGWLGVLDYVASKLSTLEVFTCTIIGDMIIGDTELSKLFSANKRLRQLTIIYFSVRIDYSRASFFQRTAAIIRSLNRCSSFRRLKIISREHMTENNALSKIISDACVRLRRRAVTIQVNDVHYL